MADTVEVVQWKLEDLYTGPSYQIGRATRQLAIEVGHATAAAARFGVRLGAVAVGGVAALSAGLAASGIAALNAAGEYDGIRIKLEAVTGSAQDAADILTWIKQFALKSPFDFTGLAQAGALLEAFGLSARRELPFISTLGAVFGNSATNLDELVRAFGNLKTGRFGEAFEALARFGISREALKGLGAQFNKGGEFLGDSQQALDMVEQLIDAKFGTIAEKSAHQWDVVKSNLLEGFMGLARDVGAQILPVVTGWMEQLSQGLARLSEMGIGKRIGDAWAKVLGGVDSGKIINVVLANVSAALAILPELLGRIEDSAKAAWVPFVDGVDAAWVALSALGQEFILFGRVALDVVGDIAQKISELFGGAKLTAAEEFQHAIDEASNVMALLGAEAQRGEFTEKMRKSFADAATAFGNPFGGTGDDFKRLRDQILAQLNMPGGSGATVASGSGGNAPPAITSPLEQIVQYGKITAENTSPISDLRDMLIGGGRRSEFALNAVDIGRAGGGLPGSINVNLAGDRLLAQFVQNIVDQMFASFRRGGMGGFDPVRR